MNRKLLLGVVIGALVLAAGGVGYAAWRVAEVGNEQDRKAEVVATSNEVDDAITKIFAELGRADTQWQTAADAAETADLAVVLGTTRDKMTALKGDVADVRALVEEIPSKPVREAYSTTLNELDAAIDKSLGGADAAQSYLDASVLLETAISNRDMGLDEVNESVLACNRKDWGAGKEHALAAEAQYQAMRDAFAQAAALPGCAEVDDTYPYIDKLTEVAREQHELAVLGSKGSINAYNRQIETIRDMQVEADELSGLSAVAFAAIFGGADEVYGHFQLLAVGAKHSWKDAQDLVTSGEI